MKHIVVCSLVLLGLCASCNRDPYRTPVKQVYVHKYGMEIDKKEWEDRGRQGQVVTTRKDGIIVRQTYDEGRLDGETTLTFPHSSTIARTEMYEEGQLRKERENYQSGTPRKEIAHELGNETVTTHWYEDGTPQSVEVAHGGFLSSAEYFDPTHALEAEVRDGEGTRIIRDGDQVRASETIFAGQMVKQITFYENGEPEAITPFVDGKTHGQRLTYHVGGLPCAVESWVNGKLHGAVVTFANGQKLSTTPYLQGKREGLEQVFGADGTVTEEISWHENKRHGPTRYIAEGDEAIDWYYEGKSVRKHTFDRLSAQFYTS